MGFLNCFGRSWKQSDQEWFYQQAAPFFDSGVMYEIYSTGNFRICNIANQCYALLSCKKHKEGVSGVLIHPNTVKEIANDNSYIARMFHPDNHKQLARYSFFLDEKRLEVFKKYKQKADQEGPSEDIDYEMEAELKKYV